MITVGYNQTDVTVSESDRVACLTVKILMPDEEVPIDSEVIFSLLVNTSDGIERGFVPNLKFDLCTHTLDNSYLLVIYILVLLKSCNHMHTHTP